LQIVKQFSLDFLSNNCLVWAQCIMLLHL